MNVVYPFVILFEREVNAVSATGFYIDTEWGRGYSVPEKSQALRAF